MGIGTIIMNRIIAVIKDLDIPSEEQVSPMELSVFDAQGENKERRNSFYENFGFQLSFNDNERKGGIAEASCVGSLKLHETKRPHSFCTLMYDMMKSQREIEILKNSKVYLKDSLKSAESRYYNLRAKLQKFNPIYWFDKAFTAFLHWALS